MIAFLTHPKRSTLRLHPSSTTALSSDLPIHTHAQPEDVCLVVAHGAPVYCLEALEDASLLTGSRLGVIRSEVDEDALLRHALLHSGREISMPFALEARGDTLWMGTYRGVFHAPLSGSTSHRFPTSVDDLSALDVSADGSLVAVGGDSDRVLLFDMNGERRWQGTTHKYPCRVRLVDDSLMIASWDGMVFEVALDALPEMMDSGGWMGATASLFGDHPPAGGMPAFDVTRLRDGHVVAVGVDASQGFGVKWKPGHQESIPGSISTEGGLHAIELSPDGQWLATGGNDKAVSVLNAADFSMVARLDVTGCVPEDDSSAPFSASVDYYEGSGAAAVFSLEWAHDGSGIYIGTQSGAVLAWSPSIL